MSENKQQEEKAKKSSPAASSSRFQEKLVPMKPWFRFLVTRVCGERGERATFSALGESVGRVCQAALFMGLFMDSGGGRDRTTGKEGSPDDPGNVSDHHKESTDRPSKERGTMRGRWEKGEHNSLSLQFA